MGRPRTGKRYSIALLLFALCFYLAGCSSQYEYVAMLNSAGIGGGGGSGGGIELRTVDAKVVLPEGVSLDLSGYTVMSQLYTSSLVNGTAKVALEEGGGFSPCSLMPRVSPFWSGF